jgi:hypothetical protein
MSNRSDPVSYPYPVRRPLNVDPDREKLYQFAALRALLVGVADDSRPHVGVGRHLVQTEGLHHLDGLAVHAALSPRSPGPEDGKTVWNLPRLFSRLCFRKMKRNGAIMTKNLYFCREILFFEAYFSIRRGEYFLCFLIQTRNKERNVPFKLIIL